MMLYLAFKAAISGILIMIVSEVARRSPSFGALIASLPLISVLGMIWLWHETGDAGRIATHAFSTFWLVLPSLPMFLLLPYLLRCGLGFYAALAISCLLTVGLYFAMVPILKRYGVPF